MDNDFLDEVLKEAGKPFKSKKWTEFIQDIITPKNFRFVIECKKGYNDINFSDFLNEKSKLWDIISKAIRESKNKFKDSLVILEQNRKKAISILEYSTYLNLNIHKQALFFTSLGYRNDLVVLLLEDFLSIPNEHFFQ